MRVEGRITKWKDDKGFGFIAPAGGGDEVFVHVSAFVDRNKRPAVNEVVTYELAFDAQKRPRARKVAVAHQRMATPAMAGYGTGKASAPPDAPVIPTLLAIFLFAALVGLALGRKLHFFVPGLYLLMSILTFLAYGNDKSRAERNQRRTPEATLHSMALFGGWPGAWIAQRVFRHKSKKVAFQNTFWLTVAANCAIVFLLATPVWRDILLSLSGQQR